jgi:4-hydroxy-2-oxoheptanedioate aldolase
VDLPLNGFKRALVEGRPQIGLWCTLASNVAIEVVAGSGFDWLMLDTEHSPNELDHVLAQLQAAAAYPTAMVVRPAWNDMILIKRILDVGAQSILIPYVQNAEEARRAVSYTRYPPEGLRGVSGMSRATRFGRIPDYARRAHEELCVMVQVETREGLSQIEEMAAVEGVDGIFVGPADLAAALGHAGSPGHPEVQAAIEDAIVRIREAGKAPGILFSDDTKVRHYLALGALFVAVGVDAGILARETQSLAARFKKA